MAKTIAKMTEEVCEWTKRKGWWNDGRTFGDMIALAHSELSEALEEFRDGHLDVYFPTPIGVDPIDGLIIVKPEGASVEFADLFIRMLHTCAHYGWNLEELYELKMAYNEKRPFRHGGKQL